MTEIIRAEAAGFCSGVSRSLEMARAIMARSGEGKAYSLGPLVHNEAVVNSLKNLGIEVVEDIKDIPSEGNEPTVIIRSHGVGPGVLEKAKASGLRIVDGTCPRVKRVQMLVNQLSRDDYLVVVFGQWEHPEVQGIVAWGGNKTEVVADPEEVHRLPRVKKIGLVAQTTQNEVKFWKVACELLPYCSELRVYNTICQATRLRQNAARQLAAEVEGMVVVGSRMSANTNQLVRVCAETGTPVILAETADCVPADWLKGKSRIGVTAGASTPEWIIEEVVKQMSDMERENTVVENNMSAEEGTATETTATDEQLAETKEELELNLQQQAEADENQENQDSMEAELAKEMPDLRQGSMVRGKVIQVKDDEVLVDVGGKSEGIIPLRELSIRNISSAKELLEPGDDIDVVVVRSETDEGTMILSKRRADQIKAWDGLEQAFREATELHGEVVQVVKGGVLVDVGARGFVPASLIERGYVNNLEKYLGKVLRLRVIDLDRNKNKVVLSQKVLLEEAYEAAKKSLWETIEPEQRRRGVVRRLTDFGAFIDLGGADGLLHISEMSWTHIDHPSEILQEGDEVEVFVLGVDHDRQRISLGLKQILPSPWQLAADKYSVGQIVNGRVVRIVPFGAFVQIEPGVEGLVHISQLADYRVEKVDDVVQVNDEIPVKILDFKPQDQRMSLSLSQAREDLAEEAEEIEEYSEED